MSRVMGGTRVNGGGGGSPSNEHDPLVTGDTQHLEDLEGGPGSGSPLGIDMQTGAAPALDNRETNSSLASFTRWMEQNVPFLVLLAFVFIYEHWRGKSAAATRRRPHRFFRRCVANPAVRPPARSRPQGFWPSPGSRLGSTSPTRTCASKSA